MKILHASKKYPAALGGDAVVVASLEKQQRKCGHQVTILTSNCDEIANSAHVYKFGLRDTAVALDTITLKRLCSLIMLAFQAFKIFRTERPSVIHTHSVDITFFISFAARWYHIPIVHTFHIVTFNDSHQSLLRRKTELLFLRGAKPAKIFVLSPSAANDFIKVGFSHVIFVPNAISLEQWATDQRREHSIFTFVAVGRLEEQKGFTHLVAAAAQLKQQIKEFQIKIAGEGSQREQLQRQIDRLQLGKHVCLLGRQTVEQLKKLYEGADAFILSSLYEGMPLSLLEAWAAHLPAIATPVSILKDMEQSPALIVRPGDHQALANGMERMLNDPALRQSLSESGNKEVQKYSWEKVGVLLDIFYDEVVHEH